MCGSQICTTFLLKLILILQDLLQSQNLEIIPIDIVVLYHAHDNVVCIHLCNDCKRSNAPDVLSHALVRFVIARAILLTDNRISSLPMRAKYGHVRIICEHTSDNGRQCMELIFL